jgi:dTDP-4-amino-4,6-dideoxygalactose transaminase
MIGKYAAIDACLTPPDTFRSFLPISALTLEFERALAAYLKTDRHVIATMTGSAALHLGLLLAGVGTGDEVILPSFNYIADVQAILWCGAVPVFCDVCEDDYSLDPARVAELITPRTKAIMPLHFAGSVGALRAIYDLAEAHSLRVVEDATHALGSKKHDALIGSFGDITCFSFDPVKIITCLDGGAVVCRKSEDVSLLHRLRLLGVDKDTTERYKNSRAWDYDVLDIGFRAHMTNINAAIGLSQLARLDEFIADRRRYCRLYDDAFRDCDVLHVREVNWDAVSPFIYTVRVLNDEREAFIDHLRRCGIASGIHFLPCHQMTLCQPFPRGPLPVTERISNEIVTLPLWSQMPADALDRVIHAVTNFEPAAALVKN